MHEITQIVFLVTGLLIFVCLLVRHEKAIGRLERFIYGRKPETEEQKEKDLESVLDVMTEAIKQKIAAELVKPNPPEDSIESVVDDMKQISLDIFNNAHSNNIRDEKVFCAMIEASDYLGSFAKRLRNLNTTPTNTEQ